MTADIDTLEYDLGTYVRDQMRLDTTILAFNSNVIAQNWIFFTRPDDMGDKVFKTPRIVIEPLDELREGYTINDLKKIFVPMVAHAWLDIDKVTALTHIQLGDAIKKFLPGLEGNEGIYHMDIIGFNAVPDDVETTTLQHVTVRFQIEWREDR